jgi:hypothetical protein
MVISGHLHQFEYLIFSTQVPAQLILGNGGTKMSKLIPTIPCTAMVHPCTVIDNLHVLSGQAKDKFGYGVIQLENEDTTPADPEVDHDQDLRRPHLQDVLAHEDMLRG